MKTPEEIKGWLEGCRDKSNCSWCPNGYQCDRDAYTLAYIQQLEAQVPKWISVKERLPDCRVLAINDRGVVAVGKIGQFYDRGENVYVCDEWDSNIGIIHVTHWMQLPEPPKEEKDEEP